MPLCRYKSPPIEAAQMTASMRQHGGPFPEWALNYLVLHRTEKISNSEQVFMRKPDGGLRAISDGDWIMRRAYDGIFIMADLDFKHFYEIIGPAP